MKQAKALFWIALLLSGALLLRLGIGLAEFRQPLPAIGGVSVSGPTPWRVEEPQAGQWSLGGRNPFSKPVTPVRAPEPRPQVVSPPPAPPPPEPVVVLASGAILEQIYGVLDREREPLVPASWRLNGVATAGNESYALIQAGERTLVLRPGQSIEGWELVQLNAQQATLQRGVRQVELRIGGGR